MSWILKAVGSAMILSLAAPAAATGFRTLDVNDLVIGVWYPSDAPETEGRLGPFDVGYAFDAAPSPGAYQPILMSHGNSGRMRNHHLTAKALADAGFVVIAPKHTPDHLVGGAQTFEALNWRTVELAHALEAVLQIEAFRDVIDLSVVHGLGYSLGALTVLAGAGAAVDGSSADEHCAQNDDPNFCDAPSLWQRWRLKWVRDVTVPALVRDIPEIHYPLGFITGHVALIAPVGQGIKIHDDLFRARSVFVVGMESDTVTVPEFHAARLTEIIPEDRLYHFDLRLGHHSAFIAPFAKRVTDEEDIPAAKDPPGFDRAAFIAELNRDLVFFFRHLSNNTGLD